MNFRADRARQLSAAFVSPGFDGFSQTDDSVRRPKLAAYVCLTEYDAKLPAAVAFPPDDLRDTLGELAAQAGLKQLRIAETEKYAPVTLDRKSVVAGKRGSVRVDLGGSRTI